MKIIFAGTPEFALAPLQAILDAGYEVCAVLTQPDKPQGRKGILTPSPVKAFAMQRNIPVLQPARVRDEVALVREQNATLMVTCAYGQILTQELLDLFPQGVWNIHASLLPAYRGAAPIARCLIDGETQTGVTVMRTDVGLDTGDTFLKESLPILASDTCGTLTDNLSTLGARLIVTALAQIATGNVPLTPQGEGFVCKKVCRTALDFSRPAEEVARLVRGLSPAPLSYAQINGLTLNFFFAEAVEYEGNEPHGTVLSASPKKGFLVKCGKDAVKFTDLQPSGGKRMDASAFLNGRKIAEGMSFNDQPLL